MKSISFECLSGLSKRDGGLLTSEVATQLSLYGPNDILEVSSNLWVQLIGETLKDPMLWLLVGIGTTLLLIGETVDGATLLVAVLPLFLMDAFLHWRTQASTAGRLELALRKGKKGQANIDEILSSIQSALDITERMNRIIRGMRSFARDGSQDPIEKVSVRNLILDVLEFSREKFNKLGIAVELGNIKETLKVSSVEKLS